MSSLQHLNYSLIFNSVRNGSIKYMDKLSEAEGGADSSSRFVQLTALPRRQQERVVAVFSEARDLYTSVKTELNNFYKTLKDQQQIESATELNPMRRFVFTMTRFTDMSLKSFGWNASELLSENTRQIQELEKQLEKAKALGMVCCSILSVIVGVIIALVCPGAGLASVPILPCFGMVWNHVREKPIEEKLKNLRAIEFKIHLLILTAGKIQDAVYGLGNFFTDPPPYDQKLVYTNFKDDDDDDDDKFKNQVLRYPSFLGVNNSSAFKGKSLLDEEKFKGFAWVSNSSSAFKEKGPIGVKMTNDFKMKKAIEEEEGASFHLMPFSEEVGDDDTIITKRLWELSKEIIAAAIAQVEMAEHELSQIIHSVMSSL